MINIEKIRIHNFNSIEDIELEFKEGLHLILGKNLDSEFTDSNGSGKSSIVEALVYALYGKSLKSNHQRKGTNDTYVKLSFYVDNKYVELTRYYNHKQMKNKLELIVNQENITGHTQKQTQSYLQSLLKMPYEHFISSIAIIQGFPVKLLSLSSTQRKQYFISLIDFNFDDILKQLKSEILTLDEKINELTQEKYNKEKELSNVEGQITMLSQVVEDINQGEIQKLREEYSEIEKVYETTNFALNLLQEKHNKEKTKYLSEKAKIETEISQLEKLVESGSCPVCYSKVSDNLTKRIQKLKQKLNEILQDNKKLSTYEKNIKEFTEKKERLLKQKSELFEKLRQSISNLELSKKQKESIDNLLNRKQTLQQEIEESDDKIFKLSDDRNQLQELHKLFSPSGELRSIILQNYLDLYNQIIKTISNQLNQKEIQFIINEDKIDVKGIEYSSLSGGEKRKYDLITQLAFSEFLQMLNNVDFNIRIYDEVLDNLDKKAQQHILNFLLDTYYDRALYFITHNEDLKTLFTHIITIVKENNISHLQN